MKKINKPTDGRHKLKMQKSSLKGTVHFQNLKLANTGDQMKEMRREVQ